jgi:hypothetical protein
MKGYKVLAWALPVAIRLAEVGLVRDCWCSGTLPVLGA